MVNKIKLFLFGCAIVCTLAISKSQDFVDGGDVVLSTNFVSGLLYTNVWKKTIELSCTITSVEAAVAGTTRFDAWAFPQGGGASLFGNTQFCGAQTLATSLATTSACYLRLDCPPGFVYTFTSQVAGAGNAAGIKSASGRIKIPK